MTKNQGWMLIGAVFTVGGAQSASPSVLTIFLATGLICSIAGISGKD